MERADRVEIIHQALRVLASQLQPQDTLSVVVFARTARLWVDGVPGSQAGKVAEDLSGLTPEGGTNLEEAMKLAYETALRHYLANGENRVVLLTDGAANLGNVEPEALKQKVEANRKQGIALDCFGVGWEGYNDNLLETLSRARQWPLWIYQHAGGGRHGVRRKTGRRAPRRGVRREGAGGVQSEPRDGVSADRLRQGINSRRNNSATTPSTPPRSARRNPATRFTRWKSIAAGDGPLCTVHVRFRVPGTHRLPGARLGRALHRQRRRRSTKPVPPCAWRPRAAAFSEWLAASPYAGEVTPDRLLAYLRGVPEIYGADAPPGEAGMDDPPGQEHCRQIIEKIGFEI